MIKSDLGAARAYGDGVSFGEIAQKGGVTIEVRGSSLLVSLEELKRIVDPKLPKL